MKPAQSAIPNILLVDDNRDGLLVRRSLLEEVGYRVQIATNGEEGLKLFESFPFDVVVTDYRMPRMDGGEFIQQIRRTSPHARIILLSGFVDPLGLTEQVTGADVVIAKSSHEPVHLLSWVKRLLNRATPRKPPGRQGSAATLKRATGRQIWHTVKVSNRLGTLLLRYCAILLPVCAALAATPVKPPVPVKASPTVRRWMKTMTLREEVAQLVFIEFHGGAQNTRSRDYLKFVRLIRDTNVGGLILINTTTARGVQKAEPYALATFLNRMQRLARVPLMVGADFERGASMRVSGTTAFPQAMAFGAAGDPSLTRFEGEVTAREARALGAHWVYYPVADVNNNPENPIINTRSFGENPQAVAAHVKAFIEGAHADKHNFILTTAKHFPGHGDTAIDSHLSLAEITADRARLENLELVPFRAAIEAGVDSIMTGHIAVPALAEPEVPATLSPAILTGLLRTELNFNGLVITDALGMGAIVNGFGAGEAAVRALEAGADTLLMPADPDAAIRAVVAAVQSGRLTRQRVQSSVVAILSAKERLGLDHKRFVEVESIGDVIDDPAVNERAQEIADRAVTLVRNRGNLLPLAAPDHTCFVAMTENRYSSDGLTFTQEVRKRSPKAAVTTLDGAMSRDDVDDSLQKLPGCAQYAVAAFAPVSSGRGTVGMSSELSRAIDNLIATGKPVALVALGNPYLLRSYPRATAYLATFSSVAPSEIAAVKALWGEIEIRGHLPVTIPGEARYGEGIHLAATRAAANGASQK